MPLIAELVPLPNAVRNEFVERLAAQVRDQCSGLEISGRG